MYCCLETIFFPHAALPAANHDTVGPPGFFRWSLDIFILLYLTEAQGYSSLQEAAVRLIPHDTCRKPDVYGNHVTDGMLCAGLGKCADACQVRKSKPKPSSVWKVSRDSDEKLVSSVAIPNPVIGILQVRFILLALGNECCDF